MRARIGSAAIMVKCSVSGNSSSSERISAPRMMVARARVIFEHGEMVTDARPRSTTERHVLPTIEGFGIRRAKSLGIEPKWVIPQSRITLDRHSPDYEHGAFGHQVAPHFHVTIRHACSGWRRRTQPKRLPDHLDGIAQLRNVVWRQRPIRQGCHLLRDALLVFGVVAQRPQRIGQRRRRGVMASEQEDDQLVADVFIR